jgi:hypothetical protein
VYARGQTYLSSFPVKPSPALAEVIGAELMPRTEAYRRFWDYLKTHQLKLDDRRFRCDERLAPLFEDPISGIIDVPSMMLANLRVVRPKEDLARRIPTGELASVIGAKAAPVWKLVKALMAMDLEERRDDALAQLRPDGPLARRLDALDIDDPALGVRLREVVVEFSRPA